ncbi:hypothetical protein FQN50_007745 [Emmonsiellopsis sp. PD_5]|nr:hypothetical protein FQN50_007745 [Emmonsiellopsis sp. PD_5]
MEDPDNQNSKYARQSGVLRLVLQKIKDEAIQELFDIPNCASLRRLTGSGLALPGSFTGRIKEAPGETPYWIRPSARCGLNCTLLSIASPAPTNLDTETGPLILFFRYVAAMIPRVFSPRFATSSLSCCVASSSFRRVAPPNSQSLSISFRRFASRKISAPKPSRALPAVRPPGNVVRQSEELLRRFTSKLPTNRNEVTLFEAPSQRSYIFGCRFIAGLGYVFVGNGFYTISVDPFADPSNFVVGAWALICIVTAAMGTVYLRRSTCLISRISARRTQGEPEIRIKVRRALGFRKHFEIVTSPSKMKLSSHTFISRDQIDAEGWRRAQDQFRKHTEVSQVSFFRAPLQKTSFFLWSFFMNARRVFTQENFVYTDVDGDRRTLRLDITGKFAPAYLPLETLIVKKKSS